MIIDILQPNTFELVEDKSHIAVKLNDSKEFITYRPGMEIVADLQSKISALTEGCLIVGVTQTTSFARINSIYKTKGLGENLLPGQTHHNLQENYLIVIECQIIRSKFKKSKQREFIHLIKNFRKNRGHDIAKSNI